jgi:hypothetical protein
VGVVGKLSGAVTYPTGGTLSAANPTPVIAAHNADGSRAWASMYAMGTNGFFQAVAANGTALPGGADDRLAACGWTDGAAASLGVLEGTGGSQDITIGAWDAVTGAKLWGRVIGTTALNENCGGVAIDASGNVIAVGQFDGASLDLGGGFVLTGPGTTTQKYMWVARFNGATGATLAASAFQPAAGKTGSAIPRALAVGPTGNVAVAGSFTGSLSIGAEVVSAGSDDAFIALLGSSLTPVWNAVRIGGTAADLVRSIQFTSAGDLVALGQFGASSAAYRTAAGGFDTTGNASGPSVLPPPTGTSATPVAPQFHSAGGVDAMLLKLSGQTGAYDQAISYGNAAAQSGDVIAVNRWGANQISFSVTSPASIAFGNASYTSAGATDVALVFASLQ